MKKNQNQEYAILWLHSQHKKSGDIASELNISIDKVEAAIRTHSEPTQAKKQSSKKQSSKSKDLMITETSSKRTKSVAIMTGEASSLNDELKKKSHSNSAKKTEEHIFRPNDS